MKGTIVYPKGTGKVSSVLVSASSLRVPANRKRATYRGWGLTPERMQPALADECTRSDAGG